MDNSQGRYTFEMITVSYFSAGVSSAVATKMMIDKIDRIFYTHIDDQHPDTMRFVKDCEAWFGKPVEVWQSPLKSVDNACQTAGFIRAPNIGAACTKRLKRLLRNHFDAVFANCFFDFCQQSDFNDILKEIKRTLKSEGLFFSVCMDAPTDLIGRTWVNVFGRFQLISKSCHPVDIMPFLSKRSFKLKKDLVIRRFGFPVFDVVLGGQSVLYEPSSAMGGAFRCHVAVFPADAYFGHKV